MDKKKLAMLSGIAVFGLAMLFLVFSGQRDTKQKQSGYIFDKNAPIRLNDVREYRKKMKPVTGDSGSGKKSEYAPADVSDITVDTETYFSDGMVNFTTVRYFKFLEKLFKDSRDSTEHFDAVRDYLLSQFPESEADALFEIYKQYLECEMDLANEIRTWGAVPTSPEAILEYLAQIQDFRRARLGDELADTLFGAEVKSKEYAIRRAAIVGDNSLYGSEKERALSILTEDMWGDEAEAVATYPKPYTRYREKLEIYQKDLEEAESDAARDARIREFREEFFAPEVVTRLEAVDRQMAREKENEEIYQEEARAISDDPKLSDAEKQERLEMLQEEMFGDSADAFRRREAIREGLGALKGADSPEGHAARPQN